MLTLAVGQNASLLCKVWCPDATSAGCPHQDSTTSPDSTASTSMSADGNCRSALVGAVAFVREDARRTAAAPDAHNALVVPRFRLARADLLHQQHVGVRCVRHGSGRDELINHVPMGR